MRQIKIQIKFKLSLQRINTGNDNSKYEVCFFFHCSKIDRYVSHNLTFLSIFLRNTQRHKVKEKNIEFHHFTYNTIAIASDIAGTEIFFGTDHDQKGHKCV